jgi:hypothetical protein
MWVDSVSGRFGRLQDQLETYIYNSTKFHEIMSFSSSDLPWTSSWCMERKEKNKNNNNKNKIINVDNF